jgi:4-hydroxythreonine-4-phosphate dehydrogenase
LDVRNAPYVLQLLDRAIDGALAHEFDAIVTAPVHKGLINDAGTAFTGHTEYLAQRTHAARPVMLLATGTLRVALATTHLPLKDVSAALSIELLCESSRSCTAISPALGRRRAAHRGVRPQSSRRRRRPHGR